MTDPAIPPAAQITFTSSILTSPMVLGSAVTLAASIASASGVHLLDDPAVQQQAVLILGILLTALAHWFWPHKDGRLGITTAFSTPEPINVPVGAASVVTVPAERDEVQLATVTPIGVGVQPVKVAAAKDETARSGAAPMTVTVGEAK